MNNFQNFGDLDDGEIRLRMRENLLHRATIDRKNFALYDEEMDKDIAKDIEPNEDRNAFTLNQVAGQGKPIPMSCGMPTHMCKCGNGKKPKYENEQELVNHAMIRKNLRPMGKKVTKGITEYNDTPNIDVSVPRKRKHKKDSPRLVIVVNKRESKKIKEKKEKKGGNIEIKNPEHEPEVKPKQTRQQRLKEYMLENKCSLKQAMTDLKGK